MDEGVTRIPQKQFASEVESPRHAALPIQAREAPAEPISPRECEAKRVLSRHNKGPQLLLSSHSRDSEQRALIALPLFARNLPPFC
jgi:hypothetical protein